MSTTSYKVATIGGIEIYIDWTWLFAFVFFTWSLGAYYDTTFHSWGHGTAYVLGAVSSVLFFITILLHELGHSFTARALGLPVNRITLFIFGGVSNLTTEPTTPRMEFLITIAGPLTSLALSGLFFLGHVATGSNSTEVSAVLGYLASINLILAIFNLLPAFPLDGGRVFRSIVWGITGNVRRATQLATGLGKIFAYLFIGLGLLEAVALGDFVSGLWLAFIGWFLYNSATASAQQAVMDQVLQGVDVADVMDRAPAGVRPGTPVQSLVFDHLLDGNNRALPVQEPDGTFLGLATLSDLKDVRHEEWATTPVSQIMTPTAKLRTVTPKEGLRQAINLLADNSYHQLPVLDNGALAGILNRDHVLQYLQSRQLRSQQSPAATGS